MAKNVLSLQLLRNSQVFANKEAAIAGINSGTTQDGVIKLARYYTDETSATTKTIFGVFHDFGGSNTGYTIYDSYQEVIEAMQDQIDSLIGTGGTVAQQIQAAIEALDTQSPIGEEGKAITAISESDGVVSAATGDISAEHVTVTGFTDGDLQNALEEISGAVGTAVSGLDYSDTAVPGEYVSQVTETDGVIAVTRAELPTVAAITEAGKPIVAVAEDKGTIAASAGTINAEYVTVTGTGFTATSVQGVLEEIETEYKAADEAIVGDASESGNTLGKLEDRIEALDADAKEYEIVKITTGLSANVKEAYELHDKQGKKSGATIDIYYDNAYKEIYLGTSADTINTSTGEITKQSGDKNSLNYAYMKNDGTYDLAMVNVSAFLTESEFASGVTATDNIVHGVVDSTSEKNSSNDSFLTVGEDGFKIDGIKDEIDAKIGALDATVTGATSGSHITISIEELDGKLVQSGLTIQENNIASQTDLAALSAKTVTVVTSSNNSISTASTAADGTISVDVITDASKIQMSGFTSTDALSGIAQSSSITEAFQEVDAVITANEQVTAQALNDLESTKVDVISVNGVQSKTPTTGDVVATVVIDGGDVVLGPDYTKPAQGSAIATGDTVDEALGKLEAKVDAAVASGVTAVSGGSGISVDSSVTTQPVVSVDLKADAGTGDNDWHNPLKFDTTDQSLYFDSLDCGFYN